MDYQGSCTGAMLDKAGELADKYGNFELGSVEIVSNGNAEMVSSNEIKLKGAHNNPKVFLQLAFNSVPSPYLRVMALAGFVNDKSFRVFIQSTDNPDGYENVTKKVPAGTYCVNYFVIDEG
ncbi:MAG: hypothetical protein K2F81_04785 [Ruminococcus sp.]|nr:hypothetical protein [Ruminococcus sp.]